MMAEGFKIADAYVEVEAEIDRDEVVRESSVIGEEAGLNLGDKLSAGVSESMRRNRGKRRKDGEALGEDLGESAGRSAGHTLGSVLSGHLPTIFSNPYVLGAAATAGALLAPAIGAGLAGALMGAAGVGVIAGGIALIAKDPKIKKAAGGLRNSLLDIDTAETEAQLAQWRERLAAARKAGNEDAVKEARGHVRQLSKDLAAAQAFNAKNMSLRDYAKVFIQPTLNALGIFSKTLDRIKPKIGTMFEGLAKSGAIEGLATGLAGLVEHTLPGFMKMIEASGPFLKNLAPGLIKLGDGFSFFFDQIAKAGPDATTFFNDLLGFLSGQIAFWGTLIRWLSVGYTKLREFFTSIPGWVSAAGKWFSELWASITSKGSSTLDWFRALPGRIGAFLSSLPGKVRALFVRVFDLATTAIGAGIGHMVRLWLTLPGKTFAALIALPGKVGAIINTARQRALEAAGLLITRVVGLLHTLPGKAGNAVSSFASAISSRLRAAVSSAFSIGQDIVSGVIRGIGSMVGAAISAAKRAAGNIVSGFKGALGISSPSKVMAEEVGRWLLPGLGVGVQDSIPAAKRTIQSATNALLPSAPGGPGSGLSGALSGPGGGTHYHFAPGSITIDASSLRSIGDLLKMIDRLESTARAMRPRVATVGG